MLSDGELKDFARGQSLYRVLQPWWDVFSHYLTIMMFMIGTLGGTLQLTLRKIVCVPCQITSNDFCGAVNHQGDSLNDSAAESSFSVISMATLKMDLQQYAYVDAVCYEQHLHWFGKFFPYVVMLQTLALVLISNFWFRYPSTSSRLMHFVSILHKCCDSPWTTRALSETVAEQGSQPSMSISSPPDVSQTLASNESRKPMGTELLSVLDKKEAEQAKAIFEKVKKLKVHVEDKDTIYHVYMMQIVIKIVFLLFTLAYSPYAASRILFDVHCVVKTQALMPFQVFQCVHSLATIFWLLSLVYTVLMIVYGSTCLYSFWWVMRNSLREYSFGSLREESSFSDIPDVKNDFAFILHLLDQYNPLFAKRFAVFLSEVSEKKLRQLNLNYLWPLEKLTLKLVRNTQDQLEIHLIALSGIPDAVFDIRDLEVLKLQFIPDARLPQKLTQLGQLSELWLDHSPATVDLHALAFLSEKLKILRMKFTEVDQMPWWIVNLLNLCELYLYGSMFSQDNTAFINGLPKLKNLKVLFLKCSLTALPKVITNSLPSIQKLFIDNEGTQLAVLQSLKMMTQLTSLELLNCDLQRIPSPIFSLKNLQELDLRENNLKTIEEIISFQHLPWLNTLKMKFNSITYIPVYIGVLQSLEYLQLSHNHINCIPSQLFLCSRLCHLDLSYNNLSVIPNEIQDLKRLQVLNLSNNNIETLPDEMFKNKTLQSLLLSHNCLAVVPSLVSELTGLILLDLRGNQLEKLPAELEACQCLMPNGLVVEECLLNSLPPSVKEGFQRSDREYLGKCETESASNSLNCNPIICNAGYGDSSLLNSM
ncbi:volume-regulated anion channel subunit LRRC8B-like [Hypomesus transpacificus]|uniref:volume-regulated anion channel subunit LRRC8B-like n=1 Tax=Hypomesus transpacificus TaxID=137520 RepID=UPI001F07D6C9|nr:volume-regulated anion channel subunit LRRC8B-like [Hypomesus transpacificus]